MSTSLESRLFIGRNVGAVGVLVAPLRPFSPLFGVHPASHGLLSRDKTDSQQQPPATSPPYPNGQSRFSTKAKYIPGKRQSKFLINGKVKY